MASRKADKEAARERRLAQEREQALRARKTRRLQMTGGVVVAAIVVVVVLVIVSSGGSGSAKTVKPNSAAATTAAASVDKLLAGIPQQGNTLGSPSAKVTVTEYGDLECPICRDFALGAENQLIANEVRSGKVKLVYRSFPTATGSAPDGTTIFPIQQTAALAAGEQKLGWHYIELFYQEQGPEGTTYVNTAYLNGLAKQVTGLDFAKWSSDRFSPALSAQVVKDEQTAQSLGINATPSLIAAGPRSQTKPVSGAISYGQLQSMIKSVE